MIKDRHTLNTNKIVVLENVSRNNMHYLVYPGSHLSQNGRTPNHEVPAMIGVVTNHTYKSYGHGHLDHSSLDRHLENKNIHEGNV